MIHTQICVRKTPDANNNNSISFIYMTIWSYSIESFKIKLQLILVNQVSSVWFDNKLLRNHYIMRPILTNVNLEKNSVNSSINNSVEDKNCVGFDYRIFPWDWILWTMEEKMKIVFNHTRVINRTESIVVGLIIPFHIHVTYCGTSVRSVVEKTKSSKKERRLKIRTHAKLLQRN